METKLENAPSNDILDCLVAAIAVDGEDSAGIDGSVDVVGSANVDASDSGGGTNQPVTEVSCGISGTQVFSSCCE